MDGPRPATTISAVRCKLALGDVVRDRKLVVEEAKAATVRKIFERFVELGSATKPARMLAAEGVTTRRSWLTVKLFLHRLPWNRVDPLWGELFPAEQARIVHLLVERVAVGTDGIAIRLRTAGPACVVADLRAMGTETREAA